MTALPSPLLTAQQAMAYLGVSRSFLTAHRAELRGIKVGDRLKFRLSDLESYLDRQQPLGTRDGRGAEADVDPTHAGARAWTDEPDHGQAVGGSTMTVQTTRSALSAGRRWQDADRVYGEHLKKRRDDRRHDPWRCMTCSRLESATMLRAGEYERALKQQTAP